MAIWEYNDGLSISTKIQIVTDTMYLYDDHYLIDEIMILISYLSMEPNTIQQTHVTHLDEIKCSKCMLNQEVTNDV